MKGYSLYNRLFFSNVDNMIKLLVSRLISSDSELSSESDLSIDICLSSTASVSTGILLTERFRFPLENRTESQIVALI